MVVWTVVSLVVSMVAATVYWKELQWEFGKAHSMVEVKDRKKVE